MKSAVRSKRRPRSARPFVAATFAMTIDGKITTAARTPIDFTSRADKAHLISERARGDAVMVGYGTLKQDNVRLGIPREALRQERVARGQAPYPLRVIVTNAGRIDPTLNIFQTDFAPIVIFSSKRMPRKMRELLRERSTIHLSDSNAVDLRWMLSQLRYDYGVKYLACEGGPALFRSMLELDLIDQLNLTIAPFVFGGENAPTLTGTDLSFLPRSVRFQLKSMRVEGSECFLKYRRRH